MGYLDTLSSAQLKRLYGRIYDRIAGYGGACYGLDWPTLRAVWPHSASVMRSILERLAAQEPAS